MSAAPPIRRTDGVRGLRAPGPYPRGRRRHRTRPRHAGTPPPDRRDSRPPRVRRRAGGRGLRGHARGGGRRAAGGVLPTAAASCIIADLGLDAGVVLTASHNPWTDNGLKVMARGGASCSTPRPSRPASRAGPAAWPLGGWNPRPARRGVARGPARCRSGRAERLPRRGQRRRSRGRGRSPGVPRRDGPAPRPDP